MNRLQLMCSVSASAETGQWRPLVAVTPLDGGSFTLEGHLSTQLISVS